MNEFECIATYFAPLASKCEGALGLKDDAAILTPKAGYQIVISKDLISENVHFTFDLDSHSGEPITPAFVAQKLLRANLSDIAAKGAAPKYYLLGMVLNNRVNEAWIKSFAAGLEVDQKTFNVLLAGGDTVRREDGPLSFSLTIIGEVKKGHAILRSGAKPGHALYVSGTIGDGALGLKSFRGTVKGLTREHRDFLLERYHLPEPRMTLGQELANRQCATAAADISDGLLADIEHIMKASNVGIKVNRDLIPLSIAAAESIKGDAKLWDSVLAGGDDYEIVFTADPARENDITEAARVAGVQVTRIGEVVAGNSLHVHTAEGTEVIVEKRGYTHF